MGKLRSYMPYMPVSILVLVDVALERLPTYHSIFAKRRFQSLFSWMSLLNGRDHNLSILPLDVSILVLVDVALELSPVTIHTLYVLVVSILVLVDVALEPGAPSGSPRRY